MRISEERVTRINASGVKSQVLAAARAGDTELDFSGVEAVDSSAVAIVLSWLRVLQKKGLEPNLKGAPDKMLALMRLYGTFELVEPYVEQPAG
ncbi:MAG: lipid asymmetry maintenance protein MlaB [Duodenibacillus sp.]